jgi:hypothetical protein
LSCLNTGALQNLTISRPIKFAQGVNHQDKLYLKVKVGCKGLNGIKQTVVLWKGGEESYEKYKFYGMEFCFKYAVMLPFENVCLLTYECNKEGVV